MPSETAGSAPPVQSRRRDPARVDHGRRQRVGLLLQVGMITPVQELGQRRDSYYVDANTWHTKRWQTAISC